MPSLHTDGAQKTFFLIVKSPLEDALWRPSAVTASASAAHIAYHKLRQALLCWARSILVPIDAKCWLFSSVVNLFLMSRSTELHPYPTESFESCHFPMTRSCIFLGYTEARTHHMLKCKEIQNCGVLSQRQRSSSFLSAIVLMIQRRRGREAIFVHSMKIELGWELWLKQALFSHPTPDTICKWFAVPVFVSPSQIVFDFGGRKSSTKLLALPTLYSQKSCVPLLESSTGTTGSPVAQ